MACGASEQSDEELVRAAASGDVVAMQRLLHRHRSRILAYAASRIPPHLRRLIDPNDILQDTWLEVFRRLNSFRATDASSAYRWMLTIARSRLINVVKKYQRTKHGGDHHHVATGFNGCATADSLPDLLEQLLV